MAKKRTTPTRKRATPTKKTVRATSKRAMASATGPVSLAEARALVQAQAPKVAARGLAPKAAGRGMAPKAAVRGAALKVAPPEQVGQMRERVAVERQAEWKRRKDEYKQILAILKKRGVRGLEGAAEAGVREAAPVEKGRRAAAPVARGGRPLQILAEGDSWFDYPYPLFGGGIIPRLEKLIGVPILNMAKAGDEVRYMLGVKERELLIERLTMGCPAGGPWEVVLFSGGGNDIVDNPMALWIRDYDAALTPEQQIHAPRFAAALALVRSAYEDLIALRDALSPDTHLIFHCYDFAIPDGRGVCHLGPWLKPTFQLRKFPTREARFEVVKVMLQKFAALLGELEAANPRVSLVRTQGTLVPDPKSWHNELHPSKSGFDRFARLFRDQLKALFPERVL